MCTLWHRRFDRTLSYSAKVCARLKFQNLSKFCSDLRKIGICFGNRPIADFFHDQTIFLKDYELYIIGHSLLVISEVSIMFSYSIWNKHRKGTNLALVIHRPGNTIGTILEI